MLTNGQKFTNTKSGKTIVVLKVKPFGRVDMGRMMDGDPPEGVSGIACQWDATQSSVRAAVHDGLYVEQIDWYERRHELREGQVFKDFEGDLVKLDRRVPGDGTKWYVADMWGGSWAYMDSTIEPSDLVGQPIEDPAPEVAA